MERKERLHSLLEILLTEKPEYRPVNLPATVEEQALLLRCLMNIREPQPVGEDFLRLQDEELAAQREEKGVVDVEELPTIGPDKRFCLWQGDITRLKAGAIVNAANNKMLGCFVPLHNYIDNAIHSAAGVQMRLACHAQMEKRIGEVITGDVLVTRGYNLPARYVLHTVGPIVATGGKPTLKQRRELATCYNHCLKAADRYGLESLVFCCISTGVFRFPGKDAAKIAVDTVKQYFQTHIESGIRRVVFNVFKDEDLTTYQKLLEWEQTKKSGKLAG